MTNKTEKIPVAYLLHNFGRGGGTENQLSILVDNLDREKFTPYIFAIQPQWEVAHLGVNCEIKYFNIESIFSIKGFVFIFQLISELRKRKIRILQLFGMDGRVVGLIAGKLAGIKTIIVSRRDFAYKISKRNKKLMEFTGKYSNHCLVNSEAVKRMVVNTESLADEKVSVIYNGVSLKDFEHGNLLSRKDLNIPPDVPVVGIIANLRPVKRIDLFIEMASKLKHKETHFIIVGYGIANTNFLETRDSKGLKGRMHFHHSVDDVHQFLSLFDIGVLTSASEGLSNSLIEYSLAGLPSVAFDVGGNREVIIDGKTGYVIEECKVEEMVKKIDKLIENKDDARKMGLAGKEHATSNFSVSKMVNDTQDKYFSLLNGNKK